MPLKLIAPPDEEPISLDEAKLHLRVDGTEEDGLIAGLIVAARQGAEHLTGRALMPQTWELALDGFREDGIDCPPRHAYRITLPKAPLVDVTSIKYLDAAGEQQTLDLSAYAVDDYSEPARVMPAYGTCWPEARCESNSVLIRYEAGYADADGVPQQIKQWMLLQIGAMYANRESMAAVASIVEMPFADRLLDAYRMWGI
jgi:uncharacterized phiE125 gp8 family phage protein